MVDWSAAVKWWVLNGRADPDLLRSEAHPMMVTWHPWSCTTFLVSAQKRFFPQKEVWNAPPLATVSVAPRWGMQPQVLRLGRWEESCTITQWVHLLQLMSTAWEFLSPPAIVAHLFHSNFQIKTVQNPLLLMIGVPEALKYLSRFEEFIVQVISEPKFLLHLNSFSLLCLLSPAYVVYPFPLALHPIRNYLIPSSSEAPLIWVSGGRLHHSKQLKTDVECSWSYKFFDHSCSSKFLTGSVLHRLIFHYLIQLPSYS